MIIVLQTKIMFDLRQFNSSLLSPQSLRKLQTSSDEIQ